MTKRKGKKKKCDYCEFKIYILYRSSGKYTVFSPKEPDGISREDDWKLHCEHNPDCPSCQPGDR